MIERLQQHGLFDVADDIRPPLRHFRRHVLVNAPLNARQQFLVGDAFFLGPFVHRQFKIEHALEFVFQPSRVPLFGIGIGRHMLGDQ